MHKKDGVLKDYEQQIHRQAISLSKTFQSTQVQLIQVLQEIDQHKIFLKMGYTSLFAYALAELQLSESNCATFITVSRKAREVPLLQTEIGNGSLSVHKARRITPVLNKAISEVELKTWIDKAKNLSKRELEHEVAKVLPQSLTPETYRYVAEERLYLKLGVSKETMDRLLQIQDLLSSKRKEHMSLEKVLGEITGDYLNRHDPIEKAKSREERIRKKEERNRALAEIPRDEGEKHCGKVANMNKPSANLHGPGHVILTDSKQDAKWSWTEFTHEARREMIAQWRKNEVMRRDQSQCRFVHSNGQRCKNRRWLHIHHIQPKAQGGGNHVDNLITLCSAHHQFIHWKLEAKTNPHKFLTLKKEEQTSWVERIS